MQRTKLIRRHLQLHMRIMRGRVNALSWDIPDDLSEDDWAEAGIVLTKINRGLPWWITDWWAFGAARYGHRKSFLQAADWQGPSYQTCANAASICRAFETSRRRKALTFKHHAEVAALTREKADRLLDWCEETIPKTGKPKSTRELRRAVSSERRRS
jgi:hypothetical protein